jgi:hypothetical protein
MTLRKTTIHINPKNKEQMALKRDHDDVNEVYKFELHQ